ncbi:hypothetical protein [Pandoraea sputorum]|uniref:hypothetical protein n=1 Tax=Pandoraea sputorum TaxID=93222 RepID=UPI00123FA266|nr:hypothetical protein [Pandoraea sputorum]
MDVEQAQEVIAHAEELAAAVAQAEQRVAQAEQRVVLAGRDVEVKRVAKRFAQSHWRVMLAEQRVVRAEVRAALAERVAVLGPGADAAARKAAQPKLNAGQAKLDAAEAKLKAAEAQYHKLSREVELTGARAERVCAIEAGVALENVREELDWVLKWLGPVEPAQPNGVDGQAKSGDRPGWRDKLIADKVRVFLTPDTTQAELAAAQVALADERVKRSVAHCPLKRFLAPAGAPDELAGAHAELTAAHVELITAPGKLATARVELANARVELAAARAKLATARTAWDAAQVDLADARAALAAAHGEKLLKQTALIEARAALAASLQPLTERVEACIKALRPDVKNRFDFRGLYNAQATITQLRAECERSQATPASLIASLSDMAASLAAASQEVHRSKDAFAPGWALKMLQNLGAALGLVAACGVAASAALLALPSAAVISVATVGTLIALAAGTMGSTWAQERLRWYGTTQQSVCRETGLVEDHLQAVRAAAIRCEADCTLETIRVNLSAPAQLFFAPLLALDGSAKTIESGPTYGSTGHAILLGIRAGVISLKSDKGQALLCELLNAQARAAQAPDDRALRKFQQDERLHTVLRALEAHLAYRPGVSELVFLGNVCHGPLSSEKDVDARIRQHMAACKVIYLRGRTDAHRGLLYRDEAGAATIEPSAEYAFSTLTFAQWQAHDAIFCNEWVSPATGKVFGASEGAVPTDTLSLDEKYAILRESQSARAALLYSLDGLSKRPWDVEDPVATYPGEDWNRYTNFKAQLQGQPGRKIWFQLERKLFSLHRPAGEWVAPETHQRPTFGASWAELQARAHGKTPGRAQPFATVYPKPETSPVPRFQNYA